MGRVRGGLGQHFQTGSIKYGILAKSNNNNRVMILKTVIQLKITRFKKNTKEKK